MVMYHTGTMGNDTITAKSSYDNQLLVGLAGDDVLDASKARASADMLGGSGNDFSRVLLLDTNASVLAIGWSDGSPRDPSREIPGRDRAQRSWHAGRRREHLPSAAAPAPCSDREPLMVRATARCWSGRQTPGREPSSHH